MTDAGLRRLEGELRRYVGRRVAGPDADDVVQDALLRVVVGIGSLRSDARLGPWLARVARSAVVDHHRRRRPIGLDAHRGEAPDVAQDAGDDDRELTDLLGACIEPFLEGLPPDQATALRLTDLGGLRQADAAASLGIPLPTLKSRVQRGRRGLRRAFEGCCAIEVDRRGGFLSATPRCSPGSCDPGAEGDPCVVAPTGGV